jgi:molybdenum cofactor biosynthesis protein B
MPSATSENHRKEAATTGPVAIAVVTVSDTRTPETDENAAYLRERIVAAGHTFASYQLIRDEPEQVRAVLERLVGGPVQVILFNGGTGIAPRDTTHDALSACLEKIIPGFGELFRMLSFQQVGAAAMLSRAVAGVFRGRIVLSVPGSPAAVRLAWEHLIAPELQHMMWLVEG